MLSAVGHEPKFVGRLGKALDTKTGREAVRIAAMNVLSAARQKLASLDKVRCEDGNGLSCLRRVWSKFVAPRGDPKRKGEPNFVYTRVHRTPGRRHPQSTSGGDEPARRHHSSVPAAAEPNAEPRRASAAGRTERTLSLRGRPKCWTRPMSGSNSASPIARQRSIRDTWLMLGRSMQNPPDYE